MYYKKISFWAKAGRSFFLLSKSETLFSVVFTFSDFENFPSIFSEDVRNSYFSPLKLSKMVSLLNVYMTTIYNMMWFQKKVFSECQPINSVFFCIFCTFVQETYYLVTLGQKWPFSDFRNFKKYFNNKIWYN